MRSAWLAEWARVGMNTKLLQTVKKYQEQNGKAMKNSALKIFVFYSVVHYYAHFYCVYGWKSISKKFQMQILNLYFNEVSFHYYYFNIIKIIQVFLK